MKSLSVIIPAYIPSQSHHVLLIRALRSLEAQTYKNFEVICVLNGCYTEPDVILESIKYINLNIRIHSLNGKASGAIARNFGINLSNSDYIAQLDADDQYHPEKIEKQLAFFSTQQTYDFVGTLSYVFHNDNNIENSCLEPGQYQTHDQISHAIFDKNIMCHGSVMFKKKSFDKLKGYNEKNKPGDFWPELGTRMWEDWDLWQRAIKQGMKFYNLPERLYYWSSNTGVER